MRYARLTVLWLMTAWAWLAVAALGANAQEDAAIAGKIRSALQPFVEAKEVSGAVGLVGTADGVVGVAAVGLRDVAGDEAMTPDTIFRVMSMTKPVTSVAIMMLADAGKLSVDDPVEKFIPEFKGQHWLPRGDQALGGLGPAPWPTRLRDLLTHTSGLADTDNAGVTVESPPTLESTAKRFGKRGITMDVDSAKVELLRTNPPEFKSEYVTRKWAYSNAGMITLGRVVEVASGRPYDAFLKETLFDPLGMADTTFYPNPEQMKRVAMTYGRKDGELTPVPSSRERPDRATSFPSPAGGLYSTAADMAKFYQMVLSRGSVGDKRYLSLAAAGEMTRVQTGDLKAGFVPGMGFGLGWGVVREPSGVTSRLSPGSFGHGGAYGTQGWIDPKAGVFSVLMIQRVGLKNGDDTPMRGALQAVAAGVAGGRK